MKNASKIWYSALISEKTMLVGCPRRQNSYFEATTSRFNVSSTQTEVYKNSIKSNYLWGLRADLENKIFWDSASHSLNPRIRGGSEERKEEMGGERREEMGRVMKEKRRRGGRRRQERRGSCRFHAEMKQAETVQSLVWYFSSHSYSIHI